MLKMMKILPSPGGGSMVGAILGSTKQEPLVVGKPSTFMMDYLAKK
jgi:phosphoglycolate phosphatase